jgi:GNAT superfamily N-acetyltransferase
VGYQERLVIADDVDALASFSCDLYPTSFTRPVQEMVQERLMDALAGGHAEAVGLWADDVLVGVAAWTVESASTWRSAVVATRVGWHRRGIARRLKVAMLERAAEAGVVAVVSIVHWDNDPMLALNRSLGGTMRAMPDDPDYGLCVVPTSASSTR